MKENPLFSKDDASSDGKNWPGISEKPTITGKF